MAKKLKTIDFKTVSPLFEMERDGIKPFTIRQVDYKDKRFRALSQWAALPATIKWGLRITNPATGESFIREIRSVSYLQYQDYSAPFDDYLGHLQVDFNWRIILMGERLDDNQDIQGR